MQTVEDIIDIASVSQYLAAVEVQKGLYGGGVDTKLPRMLYMVRKNVERLFEQDSDEETLVKTANYLYALCGRFSGKARNILATGSVGVVSPVVQTSSENFRYLIPITAADFTDATSYDDPDIVNEELQIMWNNVNRFLADDEWEATATGIRILIDGFDATSANTDASFKIFIVNPEGAVSGASTSASSTSVSSVTTYNLSTDTAIPNLSGATVNGAKRTIVVKPNGYAYTWGANYRFSDNWPEQPGATAVGTLSIYEFQYQSALGAWACINQSINLSTT